MSSLTSGGVSHHHLDGGARLSVLGELRVHLIVVGGVRMSRACLFVSEERLVHVIVVGGARMSGSEEEE